MRNYQNIQISVVMAVCTRDRKQDLLRCLDSIFMSLSSSDEVLLVHDGEMDVAMCEFQKKYQRPNLYYFATKKNEGLASAINLGVKHASYDWIARMDPDDYCSHDRFELQRAALVDLDYPDVLCSAMQEMSKYGSQIRYCRICNSVPKVPFWLVNPVYNVTSMFKKSVFEDVGGYERFPNFIDYLFWMKIYNKGYRIECTDIATVYVNLGEDIASRRGGARYLYSEILFYRELYERKYINTYKLIVAITIRAPIRLFPKFIRKIFWSIRK